MYGFTVYVLIFCFLAYAGIHIGSLIQKEAQKSVSGYQQSLSRPEEIRKEYGVFGQKFSSKDTSSGIPPSAAEQSMDLTGRHKDITEYQSQATGFVAVPQNPASPFGVRGNNYSQYDINSPGGITQKF